MCKRIITEEQAMLDLRHLANEIYPLLLAIAVRGGATEEERQQAREQHRSNVRLAMELAETAWRKLREAGPIHDGFSAYVRALAEPGKVEWLTHHQYGKRSSGLVCDIYKQELPVDANAWLILQQAEYCPEATYARVRGLCEMATDQDIKRARARWYEAERALEAEGLLPVRVLAPPSAAGGARYLVDVYVPNDQEPALREALAWYGGFILDKRRAIGCMGVVYDSCYYTLSLADVNDQWGLAQQVLLIQQINKEEGSQNHA